MRLLGQWTIGGFQLALERHQMEARGAEVLRQIQTRFTSSLKNYAIHVPI